VRALAVNFAETDGAVSDSYNYMWPICNVDIEAVAKRSADADSVASLNCDSQTLHPQHERPRLSSG